MKFASMIPADWWKALGDHLPEESLSDLEKEVSRAYASEHRIYPEAGQVFAALHLTPLSEVKAVILGQDPYPGEGEAHGLAFSVPAGIAIPRSLRNIFKELSEDLGVREPAHGDLTAWARQGVLLLNTVLTVRAGERGSHRKLGWQLMTQALLRAASSRRKHVVFMLWGNPAQELEPHIEHPQDHCILKTTHPSPLSYRLGFGGCRHFSRANVYRRAQGVSEVDWAL